jgi:hypothetical protein
MSIHLRETEVRHGRSLESLKHRVTSGFAGAERL